ncbi:hypothetical protein HZS_746 [Henneguya salminicola]|nr:hypothetical protein HZS_746 [Henneguya salminicola]
MPFTMKGLVRLKRLIAQELFDYLPKINYYFVKNCENNNSISVAIICKLNRMNETLKIFVTKYYPEVACNYFPLKLHIRNRRKYHKLKYVCKEYNVKRVEDLISWWLAIFN